MANVGWPCGGHADWTDMQDCTPTKMDELEKKKRVRK